VPQKTTIKGDSKPQKVTIGVLCLTSMFRHYIVPSKEASAYLQVRPPLRIPETVE
jgi:hypothetical protein